MKRVLATLMVLGVLVGASAWWLTAPAAAPDASAFSSFGDGDPAAGALVFAAAGCASCHSAPGAESESRLVLSGGRAFTSDFGTFFAPNISPGPQGIGDWDVNDLARALWYGASPDGRHYYPAFPYTSYRLMTPGDVNDLFAYLRTLPVSAAENRPHEVGFPFNIRRALGGWKLLFLRRDWVRPATDDAIARGRYLVEALGHCGECHTPRNLVGGLKRSDWLSGAPNPAGKGRIPDLRPGALNWSENDIAYFLSTGFTPEFDTAGGEMAEVVVSLQALPEADLRAIAAYLKALPDAPG